MSKLRHNLIFTTLLFSLTALAGQDNARYYAKPSIYQVTWNSVCLVASEAQLKALQAQNRVEQLPDHIDVFAGKNDLGACLWPDGLYRLGNYFGVVHVSDKRRCSINSEQQLQAYGGESAIVTINSATNPFSKLKDKGACAWPAGFYRYHDGNEVIRVTADSYCGITSESQLRQYKVSHNQIKLVDRSVPVTANRRNEGACRAAFAVPSSQSAKFPGTSNAGFFVKQGKPTVYRVDDGATCSVSSPAHLKALGGERRVQTVDRNTDLYAGRSNHGTCPWPVGFYRRSDGPTVYYLTPDNKICGVRSPQQLKQLGGHKKVVTVPEGADLAAQRKQLGGC